MNPEEIAIIEPPKKKMGRPRIPEDQKKKVELPKRGRGRPRIPEDQKKKKKNKKVDAAYNLAYYYKTKLCQPVNCELCNCQITLQKLRRHQLSKKCKRLTTYKIDVAEVQEEEN